MKCPWCKAKFEPVNELVYRNVETYGGPSAIKAKCCGNIVNMTRKVSFAIAMTRRGDDDWGNLPSPKEEGK